MRKLIKMNKDFRNGLFLLCLIVFSFISGCFITSRIYAASVDIKVCFTPGERCDQEIVTEINHENKRVWVQAYYLTSRDIINAIINAKERGADVRVILDKSQDRSKRISVINAIGKRAIPVWVDNTVSIAHNKVIILGDNEVITGSYNFTKSAQDRNAENLLIIKSNKVAWEYSDNFIHRLLVSQKID